jgi:hypothetical protein
MATAPASPPPLIQPADLPARVEAYLERHHLAPSQFGMMVNREPGLVATLRKGRKFRERVLAQLLDFISKPPPHSGTRGGRIASAYRAAKVTNMKTEAAARLHRETDPVEQAKRHLQRRHYIVFAASVVDPFRTGWVVGNKPDPLNDNDLIEFARSRGWKPEGD